MHCRTLVRRHHPPIHQPTHPDRSISPPGTISADCRNTYKHCRSMENIKLTITTEATHSPHDHKGSTATQVLSHSAQTPAMSTCLRSSPLSSGLHKTLSILYVSAFPYSYTIQLCTSLTPSSNIDSIRFRRDSISLFMPSILDTVLGTAQPFLGLILFFKIIS